MRKYSPTEAERPFHHCECLRLILTVLVGYQILDEALPYALAKLPINGGSE